MKKRRFTQSDIDVAVAAETMRCALVAQQVFDELMADARARAVHNHPVPNNVGVNAVLRVSLGIIDGRTVAL